MRSAFALSAVLSLCTGGAWATVIDNFDAGNPDLASWAHAPPVDAAVAVEAGLWPDVIGGVRKTTNAKTVGPLGQGVKARVIDSFGPPVKNVLGLSTDTGGLIGEWKLEYGLAAGGTTPGDLTNGGIDNAIFVTFDSADTWSTTYVTADDGGTAVTKSLWSAGPGVLVFPYSQFAGVDFVGIHSLTFCILGNVDGDYQISMLETSFIPDPTTMAILAVGALGLISRRRKVRPV